MSPITFEYDADGLTQSRISGSSQEYFIYDGDVIVAHAVTTEVTPGHIGAPSTQSPPNATSFYIFGPTGLIGEVSSLASSTIPPTGISTSAVIVSPITYTFDPNGSTMSRIGTGGVDNSLFYHLRLASPL